VTSTRRSDILEAFDLSPERAEIARTDNHNVLVLAGPGAGKTHLLVAHACWLAERRAGKVILLTFSRKAAGEMQRRVDNVLDTSTARIVNIATLHAYALSLLRAHGYRLSLRADVEPISSKDVQALADEVARRNRLPPMPDFAQRFETYQRIRGNLSSPQLPPLVALMERELRQTSRLDWDSCIRLATELLSSHTEIRQSVRQHDRFILIDEAQDCDAGQLALLEQLVGSPPGDRHLFIVMDPDQSLYAFRHANADLVRTWATQYVDSPIEISENRRCAPRIQAVARYVLDGSVRTPLVPGYAVLRKSKDRKSEADWIAAEVETRLRRGFDANRIAILARRRSRLTEIEHTLPSVAPIRSDTSEVWTPPEERLLAILAFLKDWRDGTMSPAVVSTYLVDVAGLSLNQAQNLEEQSLSRNQHPGDNVENGTWKALTSWVDGPRMTPAQLVERLAEAEGIDLVEIRPLHEVAKAARNLTELLRVTTIGPTPQRAPANGLLVTTFHGAKGLEFETVFVVGCEDRTIPDFRATTPKQLQEERRALYVAITRAATEAVLTWVTRDGSYAKRATPFLPEASSDLWSGLSND